MTQNFSEWVGRERTMHDVLSLERLRKLAATLDLDPGALSDGAPLPPGWHWVFFHEPVPRSALAEDGHEMRGDFLPPVPLPRRMWAGGRLRFERPLRIGEEVRRVSTIRSVALKEGRSGPLAFVTVEHELSDGAGRALVEEQDIVYAGRPAPDGGGPAGPGAPDGAWSSTYVADEVTLFRFSALTFNGHRIHYDRPYCSDEEGYPGLVVHGPLLALLLLGEGARRAGAVDGGARVQRYEYRSLQPLFCGEPVTFRGVPGPTTRDGAHTLDLRGDHDPRGAVIRGLLTTRPG